MILVEHFHTFFVIYYEPLGQDRPLCCQTNDCFECKNLWWNLVTVVFYPQASQQPSAHPWPGAPRGLAKQHHHQNHLLTGGFETGARIPRQRKGKLCMNRQHWQQFIYSCLGCMWPAVLCLSFPLRVHGAKSADDVCMWVCGSSSVRDCCPSI